MYISRVDGVQYVHIQYCWEKKKPIRMKEVETQLSSNEVMVEFADRSKVMAWSSS